VADTLIAPRAEFGTTVIVRAGLTNPGGTRARISAATIVNRTDPQNGVIGGGSDAHRGFSEKIVLLP
jgi:hypothetical protein